MTEISSYRTNKTQTDNIESVERGKDKYALIRDGKIIGYFGDVNIAGDQFIDGGIFSIRMLVATL
jgi:hypothetical protein